LSDNLCYHKTKAPLKALASAFVEQAKTVGERVDEFRQVYFEPV
jgi:hypothetical protein